ncbi:MAG: hypothetical protein SP1CHLAM54_00680 [Chlamydiia bacterium]|nr:hypothetical protein [Chlamydiia bacterium]MCH9614990.1 hypothetical protein [Chlamydiia bacterium]MCH9629960.1 hypothetical protein [Chlamydiia bacterium]
MAAPAENHSNIDEWELLHQVKRENPEKAINALDALIALVVSCGDKERINEIHFEAKMKGIDHIIQPEIAKKAQQLLHFSSNSHYGNEHLHISMDSSQQQDPRLAELHELRLEVFLNKTADKTQLSHRIEQIKKYSDGDGVDDQFRKKVSELVSMAVEKIGYKKKR